MRPDIKKPLLHGILEKGFLKGSNPSLYMIEE